MKIRPFHRWDVTPKEAIALQEKFRRDVDCRRSFERLETVAGADIAFEDERAVAAVIVYRFSEPLCFREGREPTGGGELIETERAEAVGRFEFPYVPGLLSFREAPLLLAAFAKLSMAPDIVLFDGQGIAHPRRFGLASHMGLWLGLPTIGCAKSRLFGVHGEPGPEKGDWTPLTAGRRSLVTGRGVVGAVLRTRRGVRPIYVSIGHGIDRESAISVVLACLDRTRIPVPTREADRLVGVLAHATTHYGRRKG